MALNELNELTEDVFALSNPETRQDDSVHVYGKSHAVCGTDVRGHATPRGASPEELVLDATEGFIPLWDRDVVLRWRFDRDSLARFAEPARAADGLRLLMAKALEQWGDAVPVRFAERDDAFDFEVSVREADRCSRTGCVLASAFFPDPGRHTLTIYPKFFEQPKTEQLETLAHEFGHVFGLRHFFALIKETDWPAVLYGEHKPFTIMNYGDQSAMTPADRKDLRQLYQVVWSGELKDINGTPVRLMRPFHEQRSTTTAVSAIAAGRV